MNTVIQNYIYPHLSGFALDVVTLIYVGLFFFFIEKIKPADPGMKFFKKDFATELCYPLFNFLISSPLVKYIIVLLTILVLEPYFPYQIFAEQITGLPFILQIFLALLISDIAVYLEHRVAHKYFWPFHSMHHMAEEVSWITTFRIHPVNALTIAVFPAVIKFFIGFSGDAIVTASYITVVLAYFQHANINLGFPKPFCYLLVSPRFHRWHHAKDKAAIDKNFCLAFPFLDLLGGTYYCPDELPDRYGIFRKKGEAAPNTFRAQLWTPFRSLKPEFLKRD